MRPWTSKPLSEFCTEIKDLCGGRDLPVFSVSKNLGVVPQAERFKKRIASANTSRYKVAKPGDFVFDPMLLWSGSISRNTTQTVGIVSPAYCVFRLVKDLNPCFLHFYLTQPERLPIYDSISFGTNERRRKAQFSDFTRLEIPVPPPDEQDRIVKLLNEADGLRELRVRADRLTADLASSLFHEMFSQYVKQPPVVASLDDTTAPQGWRWSHLIDVARLATGHTPSRRVPQYWNGNIPWISLTDIRALDGKVAEVTAQSVTEKGIENSSAVKLPKGTVCFSRTASVGFVTVMGREMCTSQDFVNWVCGDELDPIYLMGALIQARQHLRSLASGSTHQTIYFPTVEQFCVLVPPLSIQKEFAKQVTEIRDLETKQAATRERLDALFQSMLHRAFRGEL